MGETPDVLRQLTEEVCKCGLCKSTCQFPRSLPCLHSFCKRCLEDFIQAEVKESSKNFFLCPRCRQRTDLPKNTRVFGRYADAFQEDTFVSKLSEVIKAYSENKSCDLCSRRGVAAAALSWCLECSDAVCEACTSVHLHGPSTADHVVVSISEMQKLSLENVMKRKREVPCARHNGDAVKLYCVDCKEPACVQCVAVNHRKCDNCVTVADAISANEQDMAEILIRLQSMPNEDLLNNGFGDAGEVLEETVRSSRERIRAVSADLRKRIEESEESLLQKLDDIHTMLRQKMQGKSGPAKDHTKTLRAANERMQFLLKYGSDVEILQVYDSIKDAMGKLEKSGPDSGAQDTEEEEELMFRVNFMPDDCVKVFQRDYQTLGHIQVEDCNSDDGLSSWGVTCTSRDEIIVVDCRNKRVQKFTSNGDLIDHIQISEEPRDVTSCGEDDVAITVMKKQIFVVTVTGNMTLKRRIKTEKQYDAISFSTFAGKQFLVSCLQDTSVDVITPSGNVLKSFNVDSTGNAIFLDPRYVTFSKEGNYVITDVASNAVKCISPDGVLVFSYQPGGAHVLRKPQGLCMDNVGNVFIADYGNSRVQLVTNEGAFQRFVLARESGIHRPVAIHMTSTNKLIVVQSDGIVKVFSYE